MDPSPGPTPHVPVQDVRSSSLDDFSVDSLPPIPLEPERERGPKSPRFRRFWPVGLAIFGVAALIGIERLSMIVFVTDAGPALLIGAGVTFGTVLCGLVCAGAWFAVRFEADRREGASPP